MFKKIFRFDDTLAERERFRQKRFGGNPTTGAVSLIKATKILHRIGSVAGILQYTQIKVQMEDFTLPAQRPNAK